MNKDNMIVLSGIIYQFAVLFIVASLNFYVLYRTGTMNDMMSGAIIGVMASLPATLMNSSKKE